MIGNVGDSRAVLGTRDHNDCLLAVQLTVDLKPNLPSTFSSLSLSLSSVLILSFVNFAFERLLIYLFYNTCSRHVTCAPLNLLPIFHFFFGSLVWSQISQNRNGMVICGYRD